MRKNSGDQVARPFGLLDRLSHDLRYALALAIVETATRSLRKRGRLSRRNSKKILRSSTSRTSKREGRRNGIEAR